MDGLLSWVLGILALCAVGLFMARRWLDRTDRDHDRHLPP